ncbi:hypothetical protein PCE1_003663 [Barthelona sp. PCE]
MKNKKLCAVLASAGVVGAAGLGFWLYNRFKRIEPLLTDTEQNIVAGLVQERDFGEILHYLKSSHDRERLIGILALFDFVDNFNKLKAPVSSFIDLTEFMEMLLKPLKEVHDHYFSAVCGRQVLIFLAFSGKVPTNFDEEDVGKVLIPDFKETAGAAMETHNYNMLLPSFAKNLVLLLENIPVEIGVLLFQAIDNKQFLILNCLQFLIAGLKTDLVVQVLQMLSEFSKYVYACKYFNENKLMDILLAMLGQPMDAYVTQLVATVIYGLVHSSDTEQLNIQKIIALLTGIFSKIKLTTDAGANEDVITLLSTLASCIRTLVYAKPEASVLLTSHIQAFMRFTCFTEISPSKANLRYCCLSVLAQFISTHEAPFKFVVPDSILLTCATACSNDYDLVLHMPVSKIMHNLLVSPIFGTLDANQVDLFVDSINRRLLTVTQPVLGAFLVIALVMLDSGRVTIDRLPNLELARSLATENNCSPVISMVMGNINDKYTSSSPDMDATLLFPAVRGYSYQKIQDLGYLPIPDGFEPRQMPDTITVPTFCVGIDDLGITFKALPPNLSAQTMVSATSRLVTSFVAGQTQNGYTVDDVQRNNRGSTYIVYVKTVTEEDFSLMMLHYCTQHPIVGGICLLAQGSIANLDAAVEHLEMISKTMFVSCLR